MTFKVTTALNKLGKLYKYGERKKVVQGGTSAGKTFSIIPILIEHCIRNPLSEVSIVSESIPHLRRGVIKDFIKIMIMTGRFRDNQFNKSTLTYKFTNGSYIEFFSTDQPDKLRGARRTDLYVNEANNIPYEAYNQLAIRTSGHIWLDFNPTASFWAHTEVLEEKDSEHIILTYKDNEALENSIIKELEQKRERAKVSDYWANWCKVYLDGQIGSLEGVCIKDWKEIDMPTEAEILCYGLDFGFSNDPTALIGLYRYEDAYIFDEVLYQKGMLPKQISDVIKQEGINEVIYGDSASPMTIEELNQYGHTVLPCVKGKDSITNGIDLINQNKIFVTKRSTNLKKELSNYIWLKDKDGNTLNKPIDAWNHAIDSMRYALSSHLENPTAGEYFIY